MKTETREQNGAFIAKDGTRTPVVLTITETTHDDGRKDVTVNVPRLSAAAKQPRDNTNSKG